MAIAPIGETDADLTRQHAGEPLGERIIVSGRVLDEDGRPVPQHAGGDLAGQRRRTLHPCRATIIRRRSIRISPARDATITDDEGRYRFVTIRPGAYPWRNHDNAWRPAHIHFSLFGESFLSRLVTQMYFPGDPLCAFDPMFQSVETRRRGSGWCRTFDLALTEPEWALGYRFDIVLRGRNSTPFEART